MTKKKINGIQTVETEQRGELEAKAKKALMLERKNLALSLVLDKGLSYRKAAEQVGVSHQMVYFYVREYTQTMAEFNKRSIEEWRAEQILALDNQMESLYKDMQAEPEMDEDGKWILSPSQAGLLRNKSRKMFLEFTHHKARLLGLMVDRKEVDVEHKVIVANLRGVDPERLKEGRIIDGEFIDGISG